MTIGDRIRRIRKKRRLTQAELAMMSGLSLSAIQGYEQGRYEPKRKPLESIAEVFKIPVDELYDMPAQLGTNLAEAGTDLISRQALLDKFEPWLKVKDYNDGELNMLKAILYEIRFMPSAQPKLLQPWEVLVAQAVPPQPKHGKWICTGEPDESWGMMYECSICGNHDYGGNYCSYCGAKMEDSEDE